MLWPSCSVRLFRNACLLKFCFSIFGECVHNFGTVFAIQIEVLFLEIQEKIHHIAGWEGGLRGTKVVNNFFVNKLAFLRCVSTHGEGEQSVARQTRVSRGKTKKEGLKTGVEFLGLSRRETSVKYFGAPIIDPNFSREFRARFRATYFCTPQN